MSVTTVPSDLTFEGDFVAAFELEDVAGSHVLLISERVEHRHESGVAWSPTEIVAHHVTLFRGGTRLASTQLPWVCSHPDREHSFVTPVRTDVDGNGRAEVSGALEARCDGERVRIAWAFEGDVDLFNAVLGRSPRPWEQAGYDCGGSGRLSGSLRDSGLEEAARALWRTAILSEDELVRSPDTLASAHAFERESVDTSHLRGETREVGLLVRDRNGMRSLVVNSFGKTLDAYLLRHQRGDTVVAHHFRTRDGACADDDMTAVLPGGVSTSDADGDGVYELSFAWADGCSSDVSPVDATLVMFEGDDAHVIRGHTFARSGNECLPPRPLLYDDDPIVQLVDRLEARERAVR